MKVFLLGAGASKSYSASPTGVKMPIAKDFFQTFNRIEISTNPWVKIGDIVNYLRDHHGVSPTNFMDFNGDIEEVHTDIEDKLQRAMINNNNAETILYHRVYMQLIFLFCSVINEIQNGPISKAHINIAKSLIPQDYVITFNWDTLMDRALNHATEWQSDTGYIVSPRLIYRNSWENTQEDTEKKIPKLIKLHGSTNWLTSYMIIEDSKYTLTQAATPDTFYIYESSTKPYDTYDGRYMAGYEPFSYGYYPVNLPEVGKKVRDDHILLKAIPRDPYTPKGSAGDSGLVSMPLIIPPIKNKAYTIYGEVFKCLWRSAEEAISQADQIIIIGYSFPHTDVQSNLLFRNAFLKRRTIPYVTIVDPHPDQLIDKFKMDFGIPDSYLTVFQDYFTEEFPISKLLR